MNPVTVLGIALLSVLCLSVLRGVSPEFAAVFILSAAALLFFLAVEPLREILSVLSDLSARAGVSADALSVVFRGLGIALLTRFASGVCVDCGLRSLGETVDYCGQVALALLALPLVSDLVQTVSEVS